MRIKICLKKDIVSEDSDGLSWFKLIWGETIQKGGVVTGVRGVVGG